MQKALVELLSVVLDCRDWENNNLNAKGGTLKGSTKAEKPDTGGWECIYRGPLLETPPAAFGTDCCDYDTDHLLTLVQFFSF